MPNNTDYEAGRFEFDRLKNFPISFLAVALGLTGFTLAYQKAEQLLMLPFKLSEYLLYFSIFVFALISLIYAVKIIRYPKEAIKEFNHPIKLNFYPIIAKIFLILSIVYLGINMIISKYLWWAGVIVQSVFTIIILSAWVRHTKFEIHHINPSWFIPVVGCIMIPIAGVQHFARELSWFFFSIGFFWWIILTVIVLYRVIFHNPIAQKLVPTMFILFAPPVIGFISLTKLNGAASPFADMMYYFGAFLFLLIIFQIDIFFKLKFFLSWWAYSFPLDALAIGTLLMYHETGLNFFKVSSWIIFVLLNAVILMLVIVTIRAIIKKRICIEEKD